MKVVSHSEQVKASRRSEWMNRCFPGSYEDMVLDRQLRDIILVDFCIYVKSCISHTEWISISSSGCRPVWYRGLITGLSSISLLLAGSVR